MSAKQFGVEEDRLREQFTCQIIRHPPGKPGHVYLSEVVANVRANSVDELGDLLKTAVGDALAYET